MQLRNHPMKNGGMLLLFCLMLFQGIAQNDNLDIFVSSRNSNAIIRFSGENGAYLGEFVEAGSGGLSNPQEVLFHPQTGHLLVTGAGNSTVKLYNGQTGAFIRDFTDAGEYALDHPTKMSIGFDGQLYISQWGPTQRKVVRFNLETGAFIDEFTQTNITDGCGHFWDEEGNLYVASYGGGQNGNVLKFNPSGGGQEVFINSTILQGPVGIWRNDGTGDFFIVDWTLGEVHRFDSNGNHMEKFIEGMARTEGSTFGPDGNIYLCDWQLNLVNRYSPDGTSLGVFASGGGMLAPNSIVFGPLMITNTREVLDEAGVQWIKNAPNPFENSTQISFELKASTQVKLRILDSVGHLAQVLVNEKLEAGVHHFEWVPKEITAGIYFYELETGNGKVLGQMAYKGKR